MISALASEVEGKIARKIRQAAGKGDGFSGSFDRALERCELLA
ncbi:MAG TPA: hypothetical protein VKM93_23750 [Terriglobia bacterium]|nr:hypothetical protein [Terriglobia bacterium]